MQFADLMRLFREGQNEGRKRGYVSQGACDAEGIAAVIRALRDEFGRIMYPGDDWNRQGILEQFDQILGSDAGSEKVAGGPTREDGRSVEQLGATASHAVSAPATDPFTAIFGGLPPDDDAGRAYRQRATAPAPAVCEWTKLPTFGFTISCTDKWLMNSNYGGDRCPECGRLIEYKFTEAK